MHKFKVWDDKKKMFLSEDWVFVIRQNGELWFYSVHGMDKADDWFIVVWATGQTDKNGVSVDVGDHMKNSHGHEYHATMGQYYSSCEKIGSKYEDE